jgi:hypothetical protein
LKIPALLAVIAKAEVNPSAQSKGFSKFLLTRYAMLILKKALCSHSGQKKKLKLEVFMLRWTRLRRMWNLDSLLELYRQGQIYRRRLKQFKEMPSIIVHVVL